MLPQDQPQPLASRAVAAILEPGTAIILAWIAAVGLVVHSDPFLATLVLLGAIGAFIAGMVGVGGAIVMLPLLRYVPPAIGTGQLTMHEAAGITMVQVFAATGSGLAGHLREGVVDRRLVVTLGSAMMIGSLVGSVASDWLPAHVLTGLFATMAAAGAIMLFALGDPATATGSVVRDWRGSTGFVLALVVGLFSGAVGAGGAFLLIPLMLYVLHIPARVVIGSSLAIAMAGASSGLVGKVATGQVLWWPALALVAGALPAAQLGAAVSHRVRTRHLRLLLAALIAATAVKMWMEILLGPVNPPVR